MTELGYALPEPAVPLAVRRRSRGRRLALATALWAIALGNAAIIVWLWLNGGGISAVHNAGDLATSLGRITGLLGAYFALIQVLLLARLPWLERLVGFDRLTVWHRRNGKLTLYLVLAHVVLITLGYAAMDKISVPSEVSRLLNSYPGMITATVGTALFIVVVATSIVIVRRRLPYESWYAVHLLAYAAIALSWFHQIPTGNELSVDAVAANYWRALYVATLAILVVFRIAVPLVRTFALGLRVEEVVAEGPDVVSLRIGGRRLERLNASGGQFFLWRFLSTRGRWWEAHPFSLSAAPNGTVAPDHREGRRRLHARAARRATRHARRRRGPVRRLRRRGAPARQGAADRRRNRDHAGAEPARRDARRRRGALPRRPRRRDRVPRRARHARARARRSR